MLDSEYFRMVNFQGHLGRSIQLPIYPKFFTATKTEQGLSYPPFQFNYRVWRLICSQSIHLYSQLQPLPSSFSGSVLPSVLHNQHFYYHHCCAQANAVFRTINSRTYRPDSRSLSLTLGSTAGADEVPAFSSGWKTSLGYLYIYM